MQPKYEINNNNVRVNIGKSVFPKQVAEKSHNLYSWHKRHVNAMRSIVRKNKNFEFLIIPLMKVLKKKKKSIYSIKQEN